jgi:hypothetical protein
LGLAFILHAVVVGVIVAANEGFIATSAKQMPTVGSGWPGEECFSFRFEGPEASGATGCLLLSQVDVSGRFHATKEGTAFRRTAFMIRRRKVLAAVITFWHLACLTGLLLYGRVMGRAVRIVYAFWFGDIQATYGTFTHVAEYAADAVFTALATLLSLVLFDFLVRRRRKWKRTLVTFLGWQAAGVAGPRRQKLVHRHNLDFGLGGTL